MMGYFYFYQPQGVPLAQPPEQQVEAPAADPTPPTPALTPASEGAATVEAAEPVPQVAATAEREIVVETDTFTVVFSNRGAVVKSWLLKDYMDALGEPLDLVHQDGAAAA